MMMAPPEPPPVDLGDDDRLRRARLRLWQITASFLTVAVTAWFCSLGPIPAVLALITAKHVLVAILAWGLGVDDARGS